MGLEKLTADEQQWVENEGHNALTVFDNAIEVAEAVAASLKERRQAVREHLHSAEYRLASFEMTSVLSYLSSAVAWCRPEEFASAACRLQQVAELVDPIWRGA